MEKERKRTRHFRKPDEIARILEQWKNSGKTKHQFCKAKGIVYSSLLKWIKKGGLERTKKRAAKKESTDFIPVMLNGGSSARVEIIYPNGCRINFYSPVPVEQIKSLIL